MQLRKSEQKWDELDWNVTAWCRQGCRHSKFSKLLLPPTGNANRLKTEGVKLDTKIIFSLDSESVSKNQRMQLLERRGECIAGNEERKTGTIEGCKQLASVIYHSAHECHWWMPIHCFTSRAPKICIYRWYQHCSEAQQIQQLNHQYKCWNCT